jgi:prolyl-tRNA editing enzyme YbaK/EbsC (Cys-tRNA(Pro) deacylase)
MALIDDLLADNKRAPGDFKPTGLRLSAEQRKLVATLAIAHSTSMMHILRTVVAALDEGHSVAVDPFACKLVVRKTKNSK